MATRKQPLSRGTIEYMRQNDLWHFDKECPDAQFTVLGRFEGRWRENISEISFSSAKSIDTAMAHRIEGSVFDDIHKGNIADSKVIGYSKDLEYANVYDEKQNHHELPEAFRSMADKVGLANYYAKATEQLPGQIWPFHFDNFHALRANDEDPWVDPRIRRILIALEDWDWGHYFMFGNSVWHNWKAGEIIYFDWLVPHATANCGPSPRYTLFVTGFVTEKLDQWLSSSEYRTIQI